MMLRVLAATALVLGGVHATAAQEVGLMVAMEVQRDGQTVAMPRIWQPSGTAGEISMTGEFRLKLTPTLTDHKADVRVEIFATRDGAESRVGAPRIVTKLGEQASIGWTMAGGRSYRLSMLVSETEKPKP